MKKHIVGFTLFSFIVVAAAIIYAVSHVSRFVPVSEVITVPQSQSVPAKRTDCSMKDKRDESGINSPAITQAVFDVKTKRFSWRLAESEENSSILLHFFISDEKGTRYIDSVPAKSLGNDGELNFSPFHMNFGNLERQANLYLIVETDTASNFQYDEHTSRQAKFDASKAVAVTVDYGE